MRRHLFQTDGPPGLLHLFGMAVFVIGIGALLTWTLLTPSRRDAASRSWPTVPATVTRSQLIPCGDSNGRSLDLGYTYVVQGNTHQGSGETFVRDCVAEAQARVQADRYAAGQVIQVRFDPEDPTVSTVRAGALSTKRRYWEYAWWVLFVGLLVRAWVRYRAGKE